MTAIFKDHATNRAHLLVDYSEDGRTVLTVAPDDQPDGVQFTISADQLPGVLTQMAGGYTVDREAAENVAEHLVDGTLDQRNLIDTVRTMLTGLDWATNGVPLPDAPVDDAPAADPEASDDAETLRSELREAYEEMERFRFAVYAENAKLRGDVDAMAGALGSAVHALTAALESIGRAA